MGYTKPFSEKFKNRGYTWIDHLQKLRLKKKLANKKK